jgi:hypothetical protein
MGQRFFGHRLRFRRLRAPGKKRGFCRLRSMGQRKSDTLLGDEWADVTCHGAPCATLILTRQGYVGVSGEAAREGPGPFIAWGWSAGGTAFARLDPSNLARRAFHFTLALR